MIFNNGDGEVRVQVDAVNETIWLNQKGIAELFGVTKANISYHLIKIFVSGELSESMAVKEILIPVQNGVRGLSSTSVKFYNLDAIIAVGYRVNSKRATAFRSRGFENAGDYLSDSSGCRCASLRAKKSLQ